MPASPDDLFVSAGRKYNVDPRLLKTVFMLESSGGQNTGASIPGDPDSPIGGMQMRPSTAKAMGASDPRDLSQAIPAAARYLAEGLDATGSPQGALAYYHGGPDRSIWGPKTAAYVARGVSTFPTIQIAGGQAVAQPQNAAATDPDMAAGEALLKTLTAPRQNGTAGGARASVGASGVAGGPGASGGAGGAPGGSPAAVDPDMAAGEQLLKTLTAGAGKEAPGAAAGQPAEGDRGGIGRNIAAGASDAIANAVNFVSNPSGSIGKMVAVPLVAAHDLLAPMFGGQRFPDAVREQLLGDEIPQPGNAVVSAAGNKLLGMDPANVAANTPAERLARKVTGGAGSMLLMAPGGATAALAGAAGAAAGDAAGQAAPAWAAPVAELAGNIAGGAAAIPVARGVGAVRGAVNRFGNGEPVMPAKAPVAGATARPSAAVADGTAEAANGRPGAPGAAPAPESVGAAATSSADATMTPAEVQAYRSTAEGQKLLEPQQVGQRDAKQYVPGVTPNAAEIEQSVNTARELKALGTTVPEVSQEAREIASANNDARQQFFSRIAGSDVDVMNAKAARAAQAEKDLASTWANAKPADASPVIELANQIKASPDGRRTLVVKAVDDATRQLMDSDGKLITDPEQLYGVRKHIDDLLSKEAAASNPASVRVKSNLLALKDALDQAITEAAPGFKQYLDNFSKASNRIDEMEALQGHEKRLYDAQNRMSYAKVQNLMRQIVDARQSPGLNPYKSISDDTMQKLWALRDDLRRSASAQELARTPGGSDTAQNAWDMAKQFAKGQGARGAAHAVAAHVAPGVGNLAVEFGGQLLRGMRDQRAATTNRARGMDLLRPKPINPLMEP